MLCDFAEEVNGKLYVMGGGWTRALKQFDSVSFSIAGKLFIPWNDTNRRLATQLALFDGDGTPVEVNGERVVVDADLEVGRPAGVLQGTEIDIPLTFRFNNVPLSAGRYRWDFRVADTHVAEAIFDVIVP
ncbi:DUF6941 family protein [Leifsonia sp. Leaf336]|uniref:DUF6941 family protein n=1 Tax=Leifsonia sp. Leaf336 TaxID=1736341 RepID=UPI000A847978|nr:hypothetical protein [Leifsonia sp. Leaf336]